MYKQSGAEYERRMLLYDDDNLEKVQSFTAEFSARGFQVIRYEDDLHFRVEYEEAFRSDEGKYAILVRQDAYVPYDVRKLSREYHVSYGQLYPKLNRFVLRETTDLNLDLLSLAYENVYDDLTGRADTESFIRSTVCSKDNVRKYLDRQAAQLHSQAASATDYKDWMRIANMKAQIHVLAEEYRISVDVEDVNDLFVSFVLDNFGKLSSKIDRTSPVLVSKAMEYMHDHSKKFVIIVMDGMSEFDWTILSRSFGDVVYEKADAYAMIPTITSISRQCLLSNKYPMQLVNPWGQSKEKQEFTDCARSLGYTDA